MRSVVSVGIGDEDGTVFAADLDRLAGVRALVEQVAASSASSSGIHSRMACHGGSMGSKVSMSKGGAGGGGMSIIPSQSPCSRRENWISPARKKVSTTLIRSPPPAPSPFRCAPGPLLRHGLSRGYRRRSAHGAFAARALERVGAPDAEDEVAPERAHGAGGDFGRRDDRWLGRGRLFAGGFRERSGWAWHAAAFVRVETVVADRLLPSWWDVIDGGGVLAFVTK